MAPLPHTLEEFVEWVADYNDREIDGAIIQSVPYGIPITDTQMLSLNPVVAIESIRELVATTRYPRV